MYVTGLLLFLKAGQRCYFSPERGANYCDYLVCLSVPSHISETTWQLTNFFACCLWPWLDPPPTALWHVMYFRFCAWRHVFTLRALRCVTSIPKLRKDSATAETTALIPIELRSMIKTGKYTSRVAHRRGAKSAIFGCLVELVAAKSVRRLFRTLIF